MSLDRYTLAFLVILAARPASADGAGAEPDHCGWEAWLELLQQGPDVLVRVGIADWCDPCHVSHEGCPECRLQRHGEEGAVAVLDRHVFHPRDQVEEVPGCEPVALNTEDASSDAHRWCLEDCDRCPEVCAEVLASFDDCVGRQAACRGEDGEGETQCLAGLRACYAEDGAACGCLHQDWDCGGCLSLCRRTLRPCCDCQYGCAMREWCADCDGDDVPECLHGCMPTGWYEVREPCVPPGRWRYDLGWREQREREYAWQEAASEVVDVAEVASDCVWPDPDAGRQDAGGGRADASSGGRTEDTGGPEADAKGGGRADASSGGRTEDTDGPDADAKGSRPEDVPAPGAGDLPERAVEADCACRLEHPSPVAPLTLVMLLVALGAALLERRRR